MIVEVDGVRYERLGECTRCGECCRSGFCGETTAPVGPQQVPGACQAFVLTPDGIGGCSDRWSEFYLRVCVDFPSDPLAVLPDACTYSWREL